MYRLARTISAILSPLLFIPLLLLFKPEETVSTSTQFATAISIIFGLGVLPGILGLTFLKLTHRVSDWDIPIRKERPAFNFWVLFCNVLLIVGLNWGSFYQLTRLAEIILVWFALFTLITFYWKISAHSAGVTLFSLIVFRSMPGFLLWGGLLIVSVGWARIYLGKHTLAQIVGGAILSSLIYIFATGLKLV